MDVEAVARLCDWPQWAGKEFRGTLAVCYRCARACEHFLACSLSCAALTLHQPCQNKGMRILHVCGVRCLSAPGT